MANEKKQSSGETKSYIALGNVRHNGKGHTKGAKLSLSDSDAAPLLKAKAVKPARGASADGSGAGE